MYSGFWHEKWQKNEIGFHEDEPNALLVKYFKHLNLDTGRRIFLPLCGKTLDISWLLSRDYAVVGVELSELAIDQLFNDLEIEPDIIPAGKFNHYRAEGIDIFTGDIFDLNAELLGSVDAVYDRAALVALPEEARVRYSAHLKTVTGMAPQLLICFEYDQQQMEGPPFSINKEEIERHYSNDYAITHLETKKVSGGLKGECEATENAWLLEKNQDRA